MDRERNSELVLTVCFNSLAIVLGAVLMFGGHEEAGVALLAAGGVAVGGYSVSRGLKKQGR